MPTSHSGIARDWNSRSFGTPRFDSWCGRFFLHKFKYDFVWLNTMKKFIVIYHANESAMEQMGKSSPEESKEGMKKWMDWAEKCGDGLVDMGSPLGNGWNMKSSSKSSKGVVGYSILQAEDMDAAKKMLEGHPHMEWNEGCEIEVHECLPMPEY